MIKKLYKKISPIILSTLVLTSCETNDISRGLSGINKFLYDSTKNFEYEFETKYDSSLMEKWYNLQDQRILAERELGPDNYKNYDIIVPFIKGKWTRTSYAPLIGDLFKKYIGFKESWPEHKKKHHLEYYTKYLEDFLKQIGKDADTNNNNIISKEELEKLKNTKFLDS
jgi:hypothetical protein